MIDKLVEFVSMNNTVPVAVIVVVGFAIVAYGQAQYIIREKIKTIKKEYDAQIEKYIEDVILAIEEITVDNCKRIMQERWDKMKVCDHGETELTCEFLAKHYPMEVNRLLNILHNGFKKTEQATKQHVKINSFHDLYGQALESYKHDVGVDIYQLTQRKLRVAGIEDLVLIRGTQGIRFAEEQAVAFYSDVIDEVLRLEKERDVKIDVLNKKFKMSGLIIDFVKGVIDA